MSSLTLEVPAVATPTASGTRCAAFRVPANDAIVHGLGPISRAILASWGIGDEDLIFGALLCLREMGCNAVKHGPAAPNPRIAIFLLLETGLLGPDRVIVTVQDQGDGRIRVPQVEDMDAAEEYRGLALLCGLGVRVESLVHPAGHTVVSWMPVDSEDRERTCKCLCWDHVDQAPHCDGVVKPRSGTLMLDPFGQPVEVCRPCAESIVETIHARGSDGAENTVHLSASALLARW